MVGVLLDMDLEKTFVVDFGLKSFFYYISHFCSH